VLSEARPHLAEFLAERFTYHPLAKWEELVRGGLITVNNAKVAPDHPLAAGDAVEYLANHIPEPEVPENVKVVFQSPSLLALAKPAGLPVHPAGPFYRHTLWFLLKKEFGDIYLINRLDRETSGLVLAAFSAKAAAYYSRQLPKIAKRYLAIVHGRLPGEFCAEGYIGLDSASAVRIYPHQARHSWRAQVRLPEGDEQLLEAEPPEFYASFSGRSGILSENSDM